VNVTVTFELFHPVAFGGGVMTADIVGGVLSRLTVVAAVAEFPALSTAVPATIWPAPSPLTVTGVGHDAIPLRLSEQAKETVTLELFQPAALGGGAARPESTGSVLSILTVTEAVATKPAWFTAVPVTTWFAPSVAS